MSDMYNTLQHHLEEPEIACIMYWSLAGLDYLHKSHKVTGADHQISFLKVLTTSQPPVDPRPADHKTVAVPSVRKPL